MKNYYIKKLVAVVTLTIAFIPVTISVAMQHTQHTYKPVIAYINGYAITYDDIHESPQRAQFYFLLKVGRVPNPGAIDQHMLKKLSRQDEINRLAAKIHHIMVEREITRLRIAVSDIELQRSWATYTKNDASASFAEQTHEQAIQLQVIIDSLKLVYEKGEDSTTVYNKILKGKIPLSMWQSYLNFYSSPQNRARLSALAVAAQGNTPQSFNKPSEGFRAYLLGRKLCQAIDQEIAESDPKFSQYKTSFTYVESARNKWWQREYKQAHIRIVDPRFAEVITIL